MMGRRLVFMGNCQVLAVSKFYERYVTPYTFDRVLYVESYEDLSASDISAIREADVVVEQLTDVAPRAAAGGMRTDAEHVLIPLVACGFLWPFAGEARPGNKPTWFNAVGGYPGEVSDGYLNRLLRRGVSPEEAAEEYWNLDVNSLRNLNRLYELVMDRQRHRDEVTGFHIADLIESLFRTERVFMTPHHPAPRIMHVLVGQLFERIGVPKERVGAFNSLAREALLPWTEVPIHPSVVRHFGLNYVADDTRYRCSVDGYSTFKQWVERYMRGDWNADLEEGIALSVSDPRQALEKLETGLARSPDSPDGHFARGEALRALGRLEEAETSLRRAIALYPEEARFHYGLSMALTSLSRWEEALSAAHAAINAEPGNAHFYAAAANAAWSGRQLSEAEELARGAIALEPGKGGLRNLLASVLYEQGRFAEAEPEAARAAAMDPKDSHIHLNHSRILEALGRGDEAERAISDAVALRPGYAALHGHAAHMRARLGRIGDAISSFEEAIRLEPANPGYHAALSHALNRLGRVPDAIGAVRRAIELRPDQPADFAHLGNLLRSTDDLEAARMAYAQAAALAPDNEHYAKLLAEVRSAPVSREIGEREAKKAQVVEGQEGWLFHKIDGVFEQVCEGRGFSDRDHSRMLSLWEARQAWCQARGMEYRILIVPERHVLYEDKLPAGVTIHENRPALRLMGAADALLRPALIYPADAIRRGRAAREVCYKSDVHWTTWGAYLAYRELMESLPACRTRIVPESALGARKGTRLGDMMLWLERRDREDVLLCEPPAVQVDEVFTTRTFKVGQVDVYETAKRELPKLVLFRTSNSTYLLPLLYHHFSRIVAVASTAMHYDLLRSERPDVVISEVSERYIAAPDVANGSDAIRFPLDFDVRSFSELTGVELPLPRSARADDGRVTPGSSPGARPGHKESAAEEGGTLSDLEKIARGMCARDGLPETQWHLYVGRALGVVAAQAG